MDIEHPSIIASRCRKNNVDMSHAVILSTRKHASFKRIATVVPRLKCDRAQTMVNIDTKCVDTTHCAPIVSQDLGYVVQEEPRGELRFRGGNSTDVPIDNDSYLHMQVNERTQGIRCQPFGSKVRAKTL